MTKRTIYFIVIVLAIVIWQSCEYNNKMKYYVQQIAGGSTPFIGGVLARTIHFFNYDGIIKLNSNFLEPVKAISAKDSSYLFNNSNELLMSNEYKKYFILGDSCISYTASLDKGRVVRIIVNADRNVAYVSVEDNWQD